MKTVYILLLSCSSIFGQSFTFNDLPWLSAPTPNAINPLYLNLNYRWVSSDLGSNATINGNWVDRIVGSNWWMSAAANQPTNTGSTNGVWFDNTHYLTNNGLPIVSNITFGFIIKIMDDGRGIPAQSFPSFITATTNGTTATIGLWCVFRDPFFRDYPIEYGLRNDGTAYPFNVSSAPLTNVWTDIIFTQAITNNSTLVGQFTAYTNGVKGVQYNAISLKSGWGGFDSTVPKTGSTNNFPQVLMFNQLNQSSIRAYLRELWIWSNPTNGLFDSGSVSNFHYWRTNTYGP